MELFERTITNGILWSMRGGDLPPTRAFRLQLEAAFEDLRNYIREEIEKGVEKGIEEYMQELPLLSPEPEIVIGVAGSKVSCLAQDLQRRLAHKRQKMAQWGR